jgi:hypothetical protein
MRSTGSSSPDVASSSSQSSSASTVKTGFTRACMGFGKKTAEITPRFLRCSAPLMVAITGPIVRPRLRLYAAALEVCVSSPIVCFTTSKPCTIQSGRVANRIGTTGPCARSSSRIS